MTQIHVIHENAAWLAPLAEALDRQRLPWRDWFLDRGVFDLSQPPPEGVYYNRMSASSHTRDHRYAAELTRGGARLARAARAPRRQRQPRPRPRNQQGTPIRRPRRPPASARPIPFSSPARSCSSRRRASASPKAAFILKPNRGGKGLGVRLFHTADALAGYLDGPDYEPPVDGLHLLQQYVRAPVPLITRAEFVGGRFMYAVEVDTSDGFELCPADVCAVGDAFCPAGARTPRAKFTIIDDIEADLKRRYEAFLAANDIGVAGIEFIADSAGAALHLRRQHQHELQPRRRSPRRLFRHGRASPAISAASSVRLSGRRDAAD